MADGCGGDPPVVAFDHETTDPERGIGGGVPEVSVVSATGDVEMVTGSWVASQAAFAPDGRHLVVVRADGDYESAGPQATSLWVMGTDGSEPRGADGRRGPRRGPRLVARRVVRPVRPLRRRGRGVQPLDRADPGGRRGPGRAAPRPGRSPRRPDVVARRAAHRLRAHGVLELDPGGDEGVDDGRRRQRRPTAGRAPRCGGSRLASRRHHVAGRVARPWRPRPTSWTPTTAGPRAWGAASSCRRGPPTATPSTRSPTPRSPGTAVGASSRPTSTRAELAP